MKTTEFLKRLWHLRLTSNITQHYPKNLENFEKWLQTNQNDEELDFDGYSAYFMELKLDLAKCFYPFYELVMADIDNDDALRLNIIDGLHKDRPNDMLASAFWVKNYAEYYLFEERLNYDVAQFLSEVFEKHETITQLEDFLRACDIDILIMALGTPERHLFEPVFKKAIGKYPHKLVLKKMLADLYFTGEDYKNAIQYYKAFHAGICLDSEERYLDDCVDFQQHLNALQKQAVSHFKVSELEKSLYLCNVINEHIPEIEWVDGETTKDILTYLPALLTRLDIRIRNDEKEKFVEEYNEIKDVIKDEIWKILSFEHIPEYYKTISA